METFDGAPASPTPWSSPEWDIAVHSRDPSTWYQIEAMDAHHGSSCDAPMATHRITAYEDTVFQCHDHMMTALNASGYGVIYLTPHRLLDFSAGEAVIRWSMSTLNTGNRDWVDVWLSPWEDSLQLPLEDWLPDLAGAPRNAVQIRMDNANGAGTMLEANVYRDGVLSAVDGNFWTGYESFLTPDARRRDVFEVRISRTHIKVGMPDHDFWWVDADIADLGWDRGVVQFGHHSYNPFKDGAGGPNTRHWDDVVLEPSAPFESIGADRRYVDAAGPRTVTFDAPAPPGAHLRFDGMGKSIDVSFDGGTTWTAAQRPWQSTRNGMQFSNYWTPIPEGTTEVLFRGDRGWVEAWIAKDFHIWRPPA